MNEERKEAWLNQLALTTVLFAVAATLSTFKGSSYSTRAVLNQTEAANRWSYFQSKSIKSYLHQIQREELETEIAAGSSRWPAPVTALYRERAAQYAGVTARYETEMKQIAADARALESQRDHARGHSQTFGYAVIFLQIAVLLSSVAALLKRRLIWHVGLASGVAGLWFFASGFFAGG